MTVATARRRLLAPLAAVLLTGLLASCAGSSAEENPAGVTVEGFDDGGRFHGGEIDPGYAVPDVTLEDTDERTVALSDVMGPVTVVFFGYTNCPDVCNTQMADITSALRRADAAVRDEARVVFVTTDPQRDDAATLRKYLDFYDSDFDTDFVGLTGDMSEIRTAADALGVALTGRTKTADGYEVGHGSQLIGFGGDRTGQVVWTVGTPVGDIREDLEVLAGEA